MRARTAAAAIALALLAAWWTCARDTANPDRPDTGGTAGRPDTGGTAGRPDTGGTAGRPDTGGTAGAPARNIPPPRVERAEAARRVEEEVEGEPRDAAWAEAMEARLRERVAPIAAATGARVEAIECRRARCRLALAAADDEALAAAISRLEEPGGLAGLAEEIVIGALERDGAALRLRVTARF